MQKNEICRCDADLRSQQISVPALSFNMNVYIVHIYISASYGIIIILCLQFDYFLDIREFVFYFVSFSVLSQKGIP